MTAEELKALRPNKTEDARGTSCPGPLLAAKRSITEVPVGGVLGLLIGVVSWGALLALWVKFFSAGAVSGSALAKILLDRFPLVLNLLPSSFDNVKNFFE